MIFLIFGLILLLYCRTWSYKHIIDDPVPRSGYLWYTEAIKKSPAYYDSKRPIMYCVTNIATFMGVCLGLYMTFGWQVALLYAVMPTNVSGVTWATGNYYMTGTLFTVCAYYFTTTYTWGIIPGVIFYQFALFSAYSTLPYFAFMLCAHPGVVQLLNIIPLFALIKPMQSQIKHRKESHAKIGMTVGKVHPSHLFVAVKVVAYYICLNLWPSRLGFFHEFGVDEQEYDMLARPTLRFWLSVILIAVFGVFAYRLTPIGFWWWFVFIAMWSQFVNMGQFIAERYLYLANIGFCVTVAAFLEPYPYLYIILCTLWLYRAHIYIPAWKHNIKLFSYSIASFPQQASNYNNTYAYYAERGMYREAINPIRCAIQVSYGNKSMLLANLGNCYLKCGMPESALPALEAAYKDCTPDRKDKLHTLICEVKDKIRKLSRIRKEQELILKRRDI